ncbi:NAD-dependent epimerase/dehydratase family protein [Alphaproteobacteria bacterium]|nr:NAD-dependent epimerase/dehydratase family protein [Alphaproteobacteria bacterium]
MKILVTGAAGFIGMHVVIKLIKQGYDVAGIDSLNDYYDVNLKKARIANISEHLKNFKFYHFDISKKKSIEENFKKNQYGLVIHLAAQAGVRYSIENPYAYLDSNITGFLNILESCRLYDINKLIYASSSSVYGRSKGTPSKETEKTDFPLALYGATKKSNELMAYTYSNLYDISSVGLRFFTVYGPWGRPDMALFLFTKAILEGKSIKIFNNGEMVRDFTYIDDVVESIYRLVRKFENKAQDNKINSELNNNYKIFNVGNSKPTGLLEYIEAIEKSLGKKASKQFLPLQMGDTKATSSNSSKLFQHINFKPNTSIKEGVKNFVNWYKDFYKIS